MRQFDVFANPSSSTRQVAPFVLMLSSHYLHDLSMIVVAPLVRDRPTVGRELDVSVHLDDESLTLVLADLYSLERQVLARARSSLVAHQDDIRRGLEKLFTGF